MVPWGCGHPGGLWAWQVYSLQALHTEATFVLSEKLVFALQNCHCGSQGTPAQSKRSLVLPHLRPLKDLLSVVTGPPCYSFAHIGHIAHIGIRTEETPANTQQGSARPWGLEVQVHRIGVFSQSVTYPPRLLGAFVKSPPSGSATEIPGAPRVGLSSRRSTRCLQPARPPYEARLSSFLNLLSLRKQTFLLPESAGRPGT